MITAPPDLPLSPSDPAETPEWYYDLAKADLLDEYRRRLESGKLDDEISDRADAMWSEDRIKA